MHPSDLQLEGYVNATLGGAELLEVDDHLAGCESCRHRAAARAGLAQPGTRVRSALLPAESHLTEEEVTELAERPPTDAQAAHLGSCAVCAREVHDLRTWTRRRPRIRAWAYAAAAAVLLALLIPALVRWGPGEADPPARSALAGLDKLTAEERLRVQRALDAGVAEPPAFLAELAGRSEVLMGASPEATFRLSEPLGTVTVSDRPVFRWEALAGARTYTVSVLDEALRPVAESPPLAEPSWTPAQPLPRGRTYVWQVSARQADRSVTAPVPPAPMARFRVMEAETAHTIERLARERPDAHLLLGILSAQAGARVEAEMHFSRVPPGSPHAGLAERTLVRLRATPPTKTP